MFVIIIMLVKNPIIVNSRVNFCSFKIFISVLSISLFAYTVSAQSGSIQKIKTTTQDRGSAIVNDAQGYLYTVISNSYYSNLIKIDSVGNTIWEIKDSFWRPSDLKVINNTLYLTGSYTSGWDTGEIVNSVNGSNDLFIASYKLSGEKIWVKTYGGSGYEAGLMLETDSLENVYIAGFHDNSFKIGNIQLNHFGENDINFFKMNRNGIPVWAKTISTGLADELYSFAKTPAINGFLINGYTQFSAALGNNYFTKSNANFTVIYDKDGQVINMLNGGDKQNYMGTDPLSGNIYMHTGTNYNDTFGLVTCYNSQFVKQFTFKTRKGTKTAVFRNSQIYVYGTSPEIIQMVLRGTGYLDCYSLTGNPIFENYFGKNARINSVLFNKNTFTAIGSYNDTSSLFGHSLITTAGDQDVFIFRINEKTLSTPNIQTSSFLHLYAYPIPATDFLNIDLNFELSRQIEIHLYSNDGKELPCNFSIENGILTLNLSEIESGFYTVTIKHSYKNYCVKFLK